MTNNKPMKKLNIYEAKTHLSKYLAELQPGETIVLCKRNTPVAEIRALPAARQSPRPLGLAKGTVTMTPGFFEPLPDEVLDLFEGRSS
jgi:antitoxin (DNA-binding transcriptional repressor) of toxin-antitoxin stability system